jgi:ABC-type transporter Mla maintaining outer membrane lipid asymmetry permease subunit MlaE
MGARIRRWLRWLARGAELGLVRAGRKARKLWWTNPRDLLEFSRRLGGAVFSTGVRPRFPSPITLIRQTFRTFLRGAPVVLVLALAMGLGLGAVADKFGVLLLPLVEQTFLLAIVRDAMPIMLAVFLAARSGPSIAARLGDNRQTRFQTGRADAKELLRGTVPHLVAGLVSGWWFFRIASVLLVSGFRSGGDLSELTNDLLASSGVPLDRELPLEAAMADGAVKTALFGFIVAYVACALGVAANECPHRSPRHRAIALQSTVWESGVTALILCLLAAVLWWNVQGGLN